MEKKNCELRWFCNFHCVLPALSNRYPASLSFLFQNERSLKWFIIVSSDAYLFFTIFQVKRIMNNVFYMLQSEFEADESYNGANIRAVVLKTIKVSFQRIFHFNVFWSMSGWMRVSRLTSSCFPLLFLIAQTRIHVIPWWYHVLHLHYAVCALCCTCVLCTYRLMQIRKRPYRG